MKANLLASIALSAIFLMHSLEATAAGSVFVIVKDLPPAELLSRMTARCIQKGASIEESTPTQVVCVVPMDDSMKSLFIRALVTPRYSTNPVYKYRTTAIKIGRETTVACEMYVEYQNAYGQVTRVPITNKKEIAALEQSLAQMKSEWESKLPANDTIEPNMTQPSEPSPRETAPLAMPTHPATPSARKELIGMQCADKFSMISESGSKAVFEGTCQSGKRQLLECQGMSCKTLN